MLSSEGVYNDHERDNTSYPITVFMEVRFQGPYMDAKTIEGIVVNHQTAVEPQVAQVETPAADPVLEKAKANSLDYLCKRCAEGRKDFFAGMLKRDASFACDGQGNVIAPLTLPEAGP